MTIVRLASSQYAVLPLGRTRTAEGCDKTFSMCSASSAGVLKPNSAACLKACPSAICWARRWPGASSVESLCVGRSLSMRCSSANRASFFCVTVSSTEDVLRFLSTGLSSFFSASFWAVVLSSASLLSFFSAASFFCAVVLSSASLLSFFSAASFCAVVLSSASLLSFFSAASFCVVVLSSASLLSFFSAASFCVVVLSSASLLSFFSAASFWGAGLSSTGLLLPDSSDLREELFTRKSKSFRLERVLSAVNENSAFLPPDCAVKVRSPVRLNSAARSALDLERRSLADV